MTNLEKIAARLDRLERQNRKLRHAAVVAPVFAGAVLLIGAQKQPKPGKFVTAGWIVVEKNANAADDTKTIQAAIDSLPRSGGVVFFPGGTYKHTGLKGRAKVHLKGVHAPSVVLDYTPAEGDGITFPNDPDWFAMSDMTFTSSGKSTGWAVRADRGVHRYLHFDRVNFIGFLNGVHLANSINVTFNHCNIGHTYPKAPRGIGLQFGDGKTAGGNGVTVQDCYFSSLGKGVVTYAQACLLLRPILELCDTGVETHGTSTVVHPWVDSTTRQHFDVQPNTVGGGRSGTGALLLGYGSSGQRVNYGSGAERQRTLIIPERLDFGPGDDPEDPRGIKLGTVVIDNTGTIHGDLAQRRTR